MKNYFEVRDWLESFIPQVYGKSELGLARIKNLLTLLGNPQKKFKSIHIAGTSGKGSTSFYVARLLEGQGLKVGLHISPHLIDIRERMQIFTSSVIPAKAGIHKSKKQILDPFEPQGKQVENDKSTSKYIPVKRLVGLVNRIKPAVDAISVSQPELLPSYFEILVALSFLYFAMEKVDIAVVEVGLGGRLDATNILVPEISVITNIGLDHTELLGDTVEKIAKEKAGIIKPKVPIVTGATGQALKVIEKVAKSKNARLINIYTQGVKNLQKIDLLRSITKPIDIDRYIPYYVNSECALFALTTVLELFIGIKESKDQRIKRRRILTKRNVEDAFSVRFPGRFETIEDGVIIDGAHNADKIKTLIEWIKSSQFTVHSSQKIILVVAFKKGKNWQEMIDLLLKNLPIKKIVATSYFATTDMGKGSAVAPEEIAEYLGNRYKMIDVRVTNNSQKAVFTSLSSKTYNPKSTTLLVTGSLYLVGEARTLWKLPEF